MISSNSFPTLGARQTVGTSEATETTETAGASEMKVLVLCKHSPVVQGGGNAVVDTYEGVADPQVARMRVRLL